MSRLLIKSFKSGAATNAYRFAKFGADELHAVQGAAATDQLLGIFNELPTAAAEQSVDVVMAGITELELGGSVALTDKLVSDANGKGVAAAPAAGANVFVGAKPLKAGVAGDIIPVMIVIYSLQG